MLDALVNYLLVDQRVRYLAVKVYRAYGAESDTRRSVVSSA
jgi:hypothetical protein